MSHDNGWLVKDWKPGQFKLHTVYQISNDEIDIHLGMKDREGKVQMLFPAQFIPSRDAKAPWIAGGTGISARGLLQSMLDEAWEQGLRPRNFSDTGLQLGATRAHLADMRALVSGKMKVQLP